MNFHVGLGKGLWRHAGGRHKTSSLPSHPQAGAVDFRPTNQVTRTRTVLGGPAHPVIAVW